MRSNTAARSGFLRASAVNALALASISSCTDSAEPAISALTMRAPRSESKNASIAATSFADSEAASTDCTSSSSFLPSIVLPTIVAISAATPAGNIGGGDLSMPARICIAEVLVLRDEARLLHHRAHRGRIGGKRLRGEHGGADDGRADQSQHLHGARLLPGPERSDGGGTPATAAAP